MSVTGHGAKTGHVRHPDDAYFTPAWCTRAILLHLPAAVRVLDPACGDGAIIDELAGRFQHVSGIEINYERAERASLKGHHVTVDDALASEWWTPRPDLVVMNPPFKLAMEFVKRAVSEVAPMGTVAALLRLSWLSSQKRAAWLRAYTPSVYVLPRRPSFTGKGTDAADYGWFLWSPLTSPTVRILDVE